MRARRRLWRLVPLGVIAAVGGVAMYLAGDPRELLAALAARGDWLHALAQQWTIAAVVALVGAYAVLMTALWVPAWLCTVFAGFVFGIWLGALCALSGATLGATTVFLLARFGLAGAAEHAGPLIRRLAHVPEKWTPVFRNGHAPTQDSRFLSSGFGYLLAARLIPIFPFALVNIAAAATGIPLATYVPATLIGIAPSTLIYAGIGNGLSESLAAGDALRPNLLVPLACLAALLVLSLLYRLWMRLRA